MRFLIDENLSRRISAGLKEAGHDAVHVDDVAFAGADDSALMSFAEEHRRTIISCDHDFVQMLFQSGAAHPSLILTREVDVLPSSELALLLLTALTREVEVLLDAGAIVNMSPDRLRIRPLPLRPA